MRHKICNPGPQGERLNVQDRTVQRENGILLTVNNNHVIFHDGCP